MPRTSIDQRQAIAASFLPPALRRRLASAASNADSPRLGEHVALLWCDIADFTQLANRLVGVGHHGVERLHALLNEHYDLLLNCVARHGGEPQIFVGDAVLAAWPCRDTDAAAAIARAIDCGRDAAALALPRDDRDQPLRMHVHVAYGRLELLDIGNRTTRHYLPVGNALDDLYSITPLRAVGNVVVSARAVRLAARTDEAASDGTLVLPAQTNAPLVPTTLVAPVPDVPLDAWLPAPVAARLDSTQLAWVAELRPITVVFVRLRDVDHLAADAAARFADLADSVRPIIERHEAVLNQIVIDDKGPTLLAYLGIPPLAHPDAPLRGVRLGMDLVAEFAARGVSAQVGVTTGHAYCGIVGNDLRRHYTVLANHVNLAARLMLLADAELGPLCDHATRQAAGGEFDFEPCGQLRVKGYDEAVLTWRPTRHTVAPRLTPMLGRDAELAAMEQRFVQHGARGGAVAVVGEAGIGKTLFLGTLRARLSARGFRVLDGATSNVSQDSPYLAWRPIVERLLDVDAGMDVDERRTRAVAGLGPELADQAGLLNVVLPYDFVDAPALYALSGAQRSGATRLLLKTLLTRAATAGPLLVTIEDAHLCDPASWELIQGLVEEPGGISLALTSRPGSERVDLLTGAHRLELTGLDASSVATLLGETLGAPLVSDQVRHWITHRSGGHPFVVTALARVLQDANVLTLIDGAVAPIDPAVLDALALPQTIQGLITHRLDHLDPGPQLAIKVAAVIGTEFPTDAILEIYPVETPRTAILAQLAALGALGLVRPIVDGEAAAHAFQHDLVREVAYGLLPYTRRRELHRAAAAWYERRFSADLPLYFGTLAHHFEHAGETHRAVDYLEREAIRTFSAGLARQSVDLGRRAAALLGIELPTDAAAIGARIGENLAVVGARTGDAPQQLLDLPTLDDAGTERLISLLLRIGPFAFQSHQIELFALLAVTALRFTLEHGNGASSAEVYSMYSIVHRAVSGDRISAYRWSELALEMDRRNGRTLRGRVGFVHTWFHHHWTHPLRDSGAIALDAAEAAFAANDALFGCFNLSGYVIYLAAGGAPLAQVMQCAREYLQRNGRQVMNAAFHLIHELQVAKAFAGRTENPLSLTDAEYDEQRDIASICQTELGNQIGYYLVSRVKLHAHFGDWAGAIAWADKAQPLKPAFEGQVAEIELVYFHAIALLQHAATLSPPARVPLLESAANLAQTMRAWATLSSAGSRSPDFDHRAALLDAELAAARGELRGVGYESAARLAQAHGYLPDVGLANELYARRLLQAGDALTAATTMARAIAAYEKWGADAKVNMIRTLMQSRPLLPVNPSPLPCGDVQGLH